MKITRERKIIGGILAIALAGFVYDRATSSPAASSDGAGDALLVSTSSHKSAAPGAMDFNEPSLADRFAQLASDTKLPDASNMRDVFATWRATESASPSVALSDSAFAQAHHLTAVTSSTQGGGAMVDGKMLHIGQSLDGFKLIAVSRQGATFDNGNGAMVRLRINTAMASGQ